MTTASAAFPPPVSEESHQRRNALLNITGEALWGLQSNLVGSSTVLVVLLTHFGAGKETIGILPAIESLGFLLPQALGVYLFRNARTRKMRIVWWHFLCMIPFLGLMGVALLSGFPASGRWMIRALLCCWGLYVAAIGVVSAAWQDWVAHLFDQRIRGTVTGLSWGMSAVAGIVSPLVAGWALGHFAAPQVQGWLYLIAAAVAYCSIGVFCFMKDPAEDWHEETGLTAREMIGFAWESLADKNTRSILIGRALTGAGFAIGPLVTEYYLSSAGGKLSGSLVTTLAAAQTVGGAVACVTFGRLGDRLGHRFGVVCGALLQVAALVCLLVIPGEAGCIATNVCTGLVAGVTMISAMNLWWECCPHQSRAAHIVVGNLILTPLMTLAPIAGGVLATKTNSRTLFVVSLVVSVMALLWVALMVKDPRSVVSK